MSVFKQNPFEEIQRKKQHHIIIINWCWLDLACLGWDKACNLIVLIVIYTHPLAMKVIYKSHVPVNDCHSTTWSTSALVFSEKNITNKKKKTLIPKNRTKLKESKLKPFFKIFKWFMFLYPKYLYKTIIKLRIIW